MDRDALIAVLFARRDSVYKSIPGLDVFDQDRDALTFAGGMPVIAHPPCRAWGRLRQFSHASDEEKALAVWAMDCVRLCGGVLEHPAGSTLWDYHAAELGLPRPGERDAWGGWTLEVPQHWFGHKAEKNTWLYVVGVEPRAIPPVPFRLGGASHVIRPAKDRDSRPVLGHAAREHTPPDFAELLVDLAGRCQKSSAPLVAGTPQAAQPPHL
jgi:hypothetical protein